MNLALIVFVCLGIIVVVLLFLCTAKIIFQHKVRQARCVADKAIKGEANLDEHDIWLAIDILQTEWERRKLSGREATEDGVRIYKLADIWQQRKKPKNEQKKKNERNTH